MREEALLRDDCNRAPNTENEIRAANRKGTRSELVVFLTTNGFPISKSHLDKLCMLGQGPPAEYEWCHRHIYDFSRALIWANARARRPAA